MWRLDETVSRWLPTGCSAALFSVVVVFVAVCALLPFPVLVVGAVDGVNFLQRSKAE